MTYLDFSLFQVSYSDHRNCLCGEPSRNLRVDVLQVAGTTESGDYRTGSLISVDKYENALTVSALFGLVEFTVPLGR